MFDETLAHRLQAAAELLLMPSRFEPCGLTQMYAMRYGALPVARATGGLVDTIRPAGVASLARGTADGFLYERAEARSLVGAVADAVAVHEAPGLWRAMVDRAMARDFSWRRSAEAYLALYREAGRRS